MFDERSNASSDSLGVYSDYFPRYTESVDSSDDGQVNPNITILASLTAAPFPIYNVFICPPSFEGAPGGRIRRHSGP